MADRTLEVQKAIVARLKAHTGTDALVNDRVYDRPPQGVVFPYIAVDETIAIPFDAQALRGMTLVVTLHVWSRLPGAVECRAIMAAVNDALHWHALAIEAGTLVMCRATMRRTMGDPDGITTHGVMNFDITTDG